MTIQANLEDAAKRALISEVTELPNHAAFLKDSNAAHAAQDAKAFFSITVQARIASRTRAHHGLLGCSLSFLLCCRPGLAGSQRPREHFGRRGAPQICPARVGVGVPR